MGKIFFSHCHATKNPLSPRLDQKPTDMEPKAHCAPQMDQNPTKTEPKHHSGEKGQLQLKKGRILYSTISDNQGGDVIRPKGHCGRPAGMEPK